MEWKKILMVSVAILALVGVGTAWTLGNTLTLEEFAKIDLDKYDFNPMPKETEIIRENSTKALYIVNIQIDSFGKISATEYSEENANIKPHFKISDYAECRALGKTEQICNAEMKEILAKDAATRIISTKESLKEEQIEAAKMALYASELKEGDITITAAEIEAELAKLEILSQEES